MVMMFIVMQAGDPGSVGQHASATTKGLSQGLREFKHPLGSGVALVKCPNLRFSPSAPGKSL